MTQEEIPEDLDALLTVFSVERLGRYMEKSQQDKESALAYYVLNIQLAESLYMPLQILEVVLRNRIHSVMKAKFGEDWFASATIRLWPVEQEKVAKARSDIRRDNKVETPGQLVASLSFGFWTGLISPKYDWLWKTHLHQITKKSDGKGVGRKDLARMLHGIRRLRNRIAHHEPIIFMDLMQLYRDIILLTEWLAPPAARLCRQHSRFLAVYPKVCGVESLSEETVHALALSKMDTRHDHLNKLLED